MHAFQDQGEIWAIESWIKMYWLWASIDCELQLTRSEQKLNKFG